MRGIVFVSLSGVKHMHLGQLRRSWWSNNMSTSYVASEGLGTARYGHPLLQQKTPITQFYAQSFKYRTSFKEGRFLYKVGPCCNLIWLEGRVNIRIFLSMVGMLDNLFIHFNHGRVLSSPLASLARSESTPLLCAEWLVLQSEMLMWLSGWEESNAGLLSRFSPFFAGLFAIFNESRQGLTVFYSF